MQPTNWIVRIYEDISREALGMAIQCGRISRGEVNTYGRIRLSELGTGIEYLCKEPDHITNNSLLSSPIALRLAVEQSEKYSLEIGCKRKDKAFIYLGELLVKANNPPLFDRYTPSLETMFRDWRGQAEYYARCEQESIKRSRRGR